MTKAKQTITIAVLTLFFSVSGFFYWKDQQSINKLNASLPEEIMIQKRLLGYKILDKIENYSFNVPIKWRGIKEIKYLTERESNGYKFSSINVKGAASKDNVIAVVRFENKPNMDLISQAKLFFKSFNLENDFTQEKVKNIDVAIARDNHGLMGIDAYFFQKGNYTYLITNGSEDFIKEVITNGTW